MKPKIISQRPSTGNKSVSQSSRMSLSLVSSIGSVNKYPKCQQKKQHSKQTLNLICLTQNCKFRGPICAMCKSTDHSTHMVIPMKKFLQNIQACLKTTSSKCEQKIQHTSPAVIQPNKLEQQKQASGTMQQQMPNLSKQLQIQQKIQQKNQLKIQQIIQARNRMLYRLSIEVTSIAEQIRKIEQKIITQSDNAVEQIRNSITFQKNVDGIVSQLQEQQNIDGGIYKKRIESLLNIIKVKTKQSYQLNFQGINKVSQKISKMRDNFIANLQQWSAQTIKSLNNVFQSNTNIKKQTQVKQIEAKDPISLKFSSQLKMKSIILSNENKTARLNDKLPGVVLATMTTLKQKTVKLKIGNLSSAIMIGVGFKDIIKKNQFKLNSAAIGHGAYMISYNSYIYSHHMKANNMVMKGITFATGEQITISIKGQSVIFTKKSDQKSITLSLNKMTDQDWKQLAVCVLLGGSGDRVQIIQ